MAERVVSLSPDSIFLKYVLNIIILLHQIKCLCFVVCTLTSAYDGIHRQLSLCLPKEVDRTSDFATSPIFLLHLSLPPISNVCKSLAGIPCTREHTCTLTHTRSQIQMLYLWSAFLCQRLILPQPQPLVARSKWDIFIAAHYIFNLKIITIKKKLYKSNNVCPSLADTFCCCRCLCRYWCWCCHFRGAVVTTFLLIVVAEDAAVSEYWS